MSKKSPNKKADDAEEKKRLDDFNKQLVNSMVKNLDHNLQHPEEFAAHEAEVEQTLDNVFKQSNNVKKPKTKKSK